jgi:hypothetical protein
VGCGCPRLHTQRSTVVSGSRRTVVRCMATPCSRRGPAVYL